MADIDSLVPSAEERELFVGLVAPLGVDLDDALEVLKASLKGVGYETHELRMSGLLREVPVVAEELPVSDAQEHRRIEGYMDAADKLRALVGTGSILVNLAMANLMDWRTGKEGSAKPVPRTAVVFNSLEHPDEVRALRKIYGEAFSAISIFTPVQSRVEALSPESLRLVKRRPMNGSAKRNASSKRTPKHPVRRSGRTSKQHFPWVMFLFGGTTTAFGRRSSARTGPVALFLGRKLPMLRLRSVLRYAEAFPTDQKSAMPISGMVIPSPSGCLSEIGRDRRIGREREHQPHGILVLFDRKHVDVVPEDRGQNGDCDRHHPAPEAVARILRSLV